MQIKKLTRADVTRALAKALTPEQQADQAFMLKVLYLVDILLTTYTKIEQMCGYDLQWDAPLSPDSLVVPAPVPAPVPVATSGELVDPPHKPIDADECALEAGRGVMARLHVWFPSTGEWLADSTLDGPPPGRVIVGGGKITLADWTEGGYAYHVRGWRSIEPGPGEVAPVLDWPGNSAPYPNRVHAIIECRRAP